MSIEILNVRIPSDIVKWLDSLVQKGIYKSRAEAIREFCREYVNDVKLADFRLGDKGKDNE